MDPAVILKICVALSVIAAASPAKHALSCKKKMDIDKQCKLNKELDDCSGIETYLSCLDDAGYPSRKEAFCIEEKAAHKCTSCKPLREQYATCESRMNTKKDRCEKLKTLATCLKGADLESYIEYKCHERFSTKAYPDIEITDVGTVDSNETTVDITETRYNLSRFRTLAPKTDNEPKAPETDNATKLPDASEPDSAPTPEPNTDTDLDADSASAADNATADNPDQDETKAKQAQGTSRRRRETGRQRGDVDFDSFPDETISDCFCSEIKVQIKMKDAVDEIFESDDFADLKGFKECTDQISGLGEDCGYLDHTLFPCLKQNQIAKDFACLYDFYPERKTKNDVSNFDFQNCEQCTSIMDKYLKCSFDTKSKNGSTPKAELQTIYKKRAECFKKDLAVKKMMLFDCHSVDNDDIRQLMCDYEFEANDFIHEVVCPEIGYKSGSQRVGGGLAVLAASAAAAWGRGGC